MVWRQGIAARLESKAPSAFGSSWFKQGSKRLRRGALGHETVVREE